MSEVVPEDGDVDVLRETLDESETFGKRGSAFEEQARAAVASVEQSVERPAYPEILLSILGSCGEALRSRAEDTCSRRFIGADNFVKSGIHSARDTVLTIGFKRSCIQAGRASIPSATSAPLALPLWRRF